MIADRAFCATAVHMSCMTITNLASPHLPDEAETEQLHWISYSSEGCSEWAEARALLGRVGTEPEFEFLVFSAGDYDRPQHRFAQCTGGPDAYLLEIARGNTVSVVAPAGVEAGRPVWVTAEDSPWCRSSADANVLLGPSEVLAIAHAWVTAGTLGPAYELRAVVGFKKPRPQRG